MAFSDFKYPDVMKAFGLTADTAFDLFAGVPPVSPRPSFHDGLDTGARLAAANNTEKARSEWMIAPVLGEFWWRYRGRVSLHSGADFPADPAAGLTGFCDFLIGKAPQQPRVVAPVVVIFEAKRENVNDGLGQCIAGAVGAWRFNQREGTPADPVYGCVTTGTVWKFLALSGGLAVTADLREYTLAEVDQILGVLTHMVGPVPEPAAAA